MEPSVFITTMLPLSLFVIMTGLGLSLTVADFKRVVLYPKGVSIGLLNLIVLSPLLGFAVAKLLSLPPEMAVGLVLLAAAPGGTTANLLTHLARGDVALSVTMTAVSSAASVITTPLFLALAWQHFMGTAANIELPMANIIPRVLIITLIPLSVGMLLRAYATALALRLEPHVKKLALAFFIFVVIGAIFEIQGQLMQYLPVIGGATLLLNLSAMSGSYFISRKARLGLRQSTAISIELGVHNTTLAMAVAGILSSLSPLLIVPAAIYGIVMFMTAGVFVWLMHRRNAAQTDAGAEGIEPAALAR